MSRIFHMRPVSVGLDNSKSTIDDLLLMCKVADFATQALWYETQYTVGRLNSSLLDNKISKTGL